MAKKNEKNIKDKTSFSKKFKAELKKVINSKIIIS